MGQLPGPTPNFAGLFANPSIQRMLDELTDHEFEHFVKYVFEQAGYFVEDAAGQYGQGLDLRLYTGPSHARVLSAGVSVKHFTPPNSVVNGQHMMNFHGALRGMPGYAVTTSTFNTPALAEAEKEPRIWPIDSDHFLRYITYVRNSRTVEAEDTEPDPRLRTNPLAPIPPEVFLAADDVTYRPSEQTKVLALANNKGGVGKTTTALNLAFGLAALDQQVLLVDMDPQANLTRELPPQSVSATLHIGDYFARKHQLHDLVRPTQFPRVWLIPSHTSLTGSDAGIASGPGTELRFARDLHATTVTPPRILDTRPFDWIIIDTGPSMGLFTRAALAASHYVLMPVAPGAFADLAPNLLVHTVHAMEALTGSHITILGGLVTQWKDDKLHGDLWARTRTELEGKGIMPFETKIPDDRTNIEKAHLEAGAGDKKTLFSHHKTSKAAQSYTKALQEVRNRTQTRLDGHEQAGVTNQVNAFTKGE